MKRTLYLFMILWLISCSGHYYNDNAYNSTYEVDKIPALGSFETLNSSEKMMAQQLSKESDSGDKAFRSQRARVFLRYYTNGKLSSKDPRLRAGLPALCVCNIDNDTLTIVNLVSLYGGIVKVKIFGNQFQSSYFLYANLKSKFQSLTLDKQPSFNPGQQLTGFLTFTSPYFYRQMGDTDYVRAQVYFTCKTKKKLKNAAIGF